MTNVEILGLIKHQEDKSIKLFVERSYKDNKGVIINDLIPCVYWSKTKRNVFSSLPEDTRVLIKGRLEILKDELIVVVEEYRIL